MIKIDFIKKNFDHFAFQMQQLRKWSFFNFHEEGLNIEQKEHLSFESLLLSLSNIGHGDYQYLGQPKSMLKIINVISSEYSLQKVSGAISPAEIPDIEATNKILANIIESTAETKASSKIKTSIDNIREINKQIQAKQEVLNKSILKKENILAIIVMIDSMLSSENGSIQINKLLTKNEASQISLETLKALISAQTEANQVIQLLSSIKNNFSQVFGLLKSVKNEQLSNEIRSIADKYSKISTLQLELPDTLLSLIMQTVPNLVNEEVYSENNQHMPTTEEGNFIFSSENHPLGSAWFKNIPSKKTFPFKPKEHHDLGTNLKLLNFDKAAELSGSRFSIFFKEISQLQRALINFMIDQHSEAGFVECTLPYLVKENAVYGTGQLPKFKEDLFQTRDAKALYLLPTSEVALISMFQDSIIPSQNLPINLTTYSECFRSEAGSAGRDTKGLIRQHQFGKVELASICKASDSNNIHNNILKQAEKILQLLGLHYRTCKLCSADTGFGSSLTYDIEVWLPGQNKYREISSCSNMSNFQSSRSKIRSKDNKNKVEVHTLNGSGLAIGRTILAIMENYQLENGEIEIPEVLRPYMNQKSKISMLEKNIF